MWKGEAKDVPKCNASDDQASLLRFQFILNRAARSEQIPSVILNPVMESIRIVILNRVADSESKPLA